MKTERRLVVFRFNMVEVALALIILAIGLSSVMVLFPVGLRASRSSITDNNLADVAERVVSYIQAESTSRAEWKVDGEGGNKLDVGTFDTEPTTVPTSDEFFDSEGNPNKEKVLDGLFKHEDGTGNNKRTYYLYRQYADTDAGASEKNRAVDFEAMIRVGWDNASRQELYYPAVIGGNDFGQKQLGSGGYQRGSATTQSDNMSTATGDALLDKFYRTLIVEISWPADVAWTNREKRIFRMEMFNENFVPYPQSTGGGSGGGSSTP